MLHRPTPPACGHTGTPYTQSLFICNALWATYITCLAAMR